MSGLTHAAITPVRNDAVDLRQLAGCLASQTLPPAAWIVVENGSTDDTAATADELAALHPWIRVLHLPAGANERVRSVPIVRAFHAGLAELDRLVAVDVVSKLDTDVTMGPDYFRRLLAAFAAEPSLGITSGQCLLLVGSSWHREYGTRGHVWGCARTYRRACLDEILPLEEHEGWDELDALKAQLRGWTVGCVDDVPFRHYRPIGTRAGERRHWTSQGATAHWMGYRPSYLVLRALYRAVRRPWALAMIWGYARASAQRGPRCADEDVRELLRRMQSASRLRRRMREVLGRQPGFRSPHPPPAGGA